MADRLQRSLREGGYLLVTPSEASRDIQRLTPISERRGDRLQEDARSYRRSRRSAQLAGDRRASWSSADAGRLRPPSPVADSAPDGRKDDQSTAAAPQQRHGPRQSARPPRNAERRTERRRSTRDAARRSGREKPACSPTRATWSRPSPSCEAALEGDKLNPSLYYLKASILQELGRPDEAERALQSTLFLDGNFALARVMLGAIARGQSRSREAAKHFRAALSLLEQMPSDSVLPETDGLTAGEMAETVASLMESECVS